MRLCRLWLQDFRCYGAVDVAFDEGCTVITGANGQGKTSLLEAVAWVASGRSFRGVPDAALVASGHEEAIVRAEIVEGDRTMLVEAALRAVGRNRVMVNKQAVARRRDYADHLRVTVFSPDDLALVKGGPAGRRDYLDDLLEASGSRFAAVRADFERVLRQRNALLRGGVRDGEARTTLDVLDDRLVDRGGELVRERLRLVERLTPGIADAYESLAGVTPGMAMRYEAEWSGGALEVRARRRGGRTAAGRARVVAAPGDRARGHAGRPPPGRLAAGAERTRCAEPRVTGRAAHAGAVAAARRSPARGVDHRQRPRAAARRRVQRARPGPVGRADHGISPRPRRC